MTYDWLPCYRASLPNPRALAALNTLGVAHLLNIHLTEAHASLTMRTLRLIHFHPRNADTVKERINRAERTDKAAEGTVQEDAGRTDDQHDDKFTGKQDTKHAEH